MRLYLVIGIFGFLLLGTMMSPAMSQAEPVVDHVVINEIDINPPGDDSKSITEWVELYNPTDTKINVSQWSIASTTVLKQTFTIPQGTIIEPGRFLTYSYVSVWFTDVAERVQLRDSSGTVIDETPTISDLTNNFSSWQRIYDGYDTNSSSDWKFETSNAGSSNGKLTQEVELEKAQVTLDVDKPNYIFGETAIISGQVSERVFQEIPFFQPEQITIKISGPGGYNKNINLYPDFFLKYKTELNLQQVLGVNEGVYVVFVEYADSTAAATFSVGDKIIVMEEKEGGKLSMTTDKGTYIPGETVIILAFTPKVIPFEGLKFSVIDPNGNEIANGNLFPDLTRSTMSYLDKVNFPESISTNFDFITTIFLTPIHPVYGTYKIIAEYSTVGSVISLFELVEDVKETKVISLTTDKKAYGIGETVMISGRLNNLWIFSLDLEVLQIRNIALGVLDFSGGGNFYKLLDAVRLEGDSTFSYEFKIPSDPNRYGEYLVTVSKEVGAETTSFKVVENPDEYVDVPSEPFSVTTDKTLYESGDTIIISGQVNQLLISSNFYTFTVDITIKSAQGINLFTSANKPSSSEPGVILYSLTAVPDQVGNYQVRDTLYRAIYDEGTYTITASYADGTLRDTTTFSIIDPLNIEARITATLDKEVYGLGEKVHVEGIIPTSGAIKAGLGITITKPDGDTDKFGTTVDNGRFSWSWTTPSFEKTQVVSNERVVSSSNFGIYKISLAQSDNPPISLFFKVSSNPGEDSLNLEPLTVTTDKPVYLAGEKLKVLGTAIKRPQGTEGLVVPDRAHIVVSSSEFPFTMIYEAAVYLDLGGNFESTFDMPITIFKEGTYKVRATYQNLRADNIFQVNNDFIRDADILSLIIDIDKEKYYPGDVVQITARPSKFIWVEKVDIGIPTEEQTKINCGSFVCGKGVPIITLRPDPTGTFSHEQKIPNDSSSLGTYIITFDTEFGTFTKPFTVVEKSVVVAGEVEKEAKPFGDRVIEKFNRITESFIPIIVNEKLVDDAEIFPRVIQGSLFTPARGEESNVNIKVSTSDGACIIGQDSNCLITASTRMPGAIYQTIEINDVNYKVRYSGPDVRLEKFTILPDSSDGILPDSTWNVEVVKEDQSSRFYYKITYVTLE